MFLVGNTSIDLIKDGAVDIQEKIPLGVYSLNAAQMRGLYLEKTTYPTKHGKIYGKADEIASHIVEAFDKKFKGRNMGALLSGGKGLGKSLTVRLVVEKLQDKYPIILIQEYWQGIGDLLNQLSDCVIILDEFDKLFKGNVNEDGNQNTISKQEDILSILDGTGAATHNLFLFTVNYVGGVDENLRSRPGRIRYHYVYESADEEMIRKYCVDNLKNKELEDEIVEALISTRFVSLDIIRALVEELNEFPETSVKDAMDYLNIDQERINCIAEVSYILPGEGEKVVTRTVSAGRTYNGNNLSFEFSSTNEEDDRNKDFYAEISVDLRGIFVPLIGYVDVTSHAESHAHDGYSTIPQILSVKIADEKSAYNTMKAGFTV